MKSFSENLEAFQKAAKLSRTDIVELSDLNEEELDNIVNGSIKNRNALYQFCNNLDIEYTSLYSDTGFKSGRNLIDQYNAYPYDYKKLLTNHIFKALAKSYGNVSDFKKLLKKALPDNEKMTTRFFSGNSVVTGQQLHDIRYSISENFSRDKFDNILSKQCFSLIPNYNYSVARKHYGLTYKEIADYFHITTSSVANWGGKCCARISDSSIAALAKALGGFSEIEFSTFILSDKDFSRRSCDISLGARLIDPPSEDKGAQSVSQPVEVDSPKISPQKDNNSISTESQLVSQPTTSRLSASMTDDRILKMYHNLNSENKDKVDMVITDLFFSQL